MSRICFRFFSGHSWNLSDFDGFTKATLLDLPIYLSKAVGAGGGPGPDRLDRLVLVVFLHVLIGLEPGDPKSDRLFVKTIWGSSTPLYPGKLWANNLEMFRKCLENLSEM